MTRELNFDGLVGPTHNYAGLSPGNRASTGNAGRASSPRRAALQGLAKMRRLHHLGLGQGVLPPPLRPDPSVLAALIGPAAAAAPDGVAALDTVAPELVALTQSASSMWAANAATVTPSVDAADGRVHLTPANLWSTAHRSLEPSATTATLRRIFADPDRFVVHDPLPAIGPLADEGAANHGRFAPSHGEPGVHLFVHGRRADEPPVVDGVPRRQTDLAGRLIAASHGLDPERVVVARQSAAAIDAGAFHNDVVSVANGRVLFAHERAFDEPSRVRVDLAAHGVTVVEVPEAEVGLADAVASYLFNSQLVTMPDGTTALVAPVEATETASTARYLDRAVADPGHPIDAVHVVDLRQSMDNGGGPACLRLRVVLRAEEEAALNARVVVDDDLLDQLEAWVGRHYRDELRPDDLADPTLAAEAAEAHRDLGRLLELD